MEVLKAENISKTYSQNEISLQVLRSVSLCIQKGSFTAVLGRSGSGKSTLLNILAGLDCPSQGKVWIDGTDIFSLSEEKRTRLRREKTGFIFQAYELLPSLTVLDNIRLPQLKPDAGYVRELMDVLEIETYQAFYPGQLSGGQQQRTAIARALVNHPRILFADEPTGNLDSKTSNDVIGLLKMTSQEFSQTIVMITHNPEIAQMADRIVRIEDGRIAAS